jgi:hypothetical protein
MLTWPAKIGGGGRVGAQSGAERAPRPPRVSAKSILSRSAKTGGRGVLAEPAHRGVSRGAHPEGRKRRSGKAWELNAKAGTRELALDGTGLERSGRAEPERSGPCRTGHQGAGVAEVVRLGAARSMTRSGRTLARSVTFELPRASSQRDSPASINTPLTLSLRGWRGGCGPGGVGSAPGGHA